MAKVIFISGTLHCLMIRSSSQQSSLSSSDKDNPRHPAMRPSLAATARWPEPYTRSRHRQGLIGKPPTLVGSLLGPLDEVLPRREFLRLAFAFGKLLESCSRPDQRWLGIHTANLLRPVLKIGDVRFAPLVGDGVVSAPLRGDPSEMAAGVLALSVVAHDVWMTVRG